MAWPEKVVGNGREGDPVRDNGFLNGSQSSPGTAALLWGLFRCTRGLKGKMPLLMLTFSARGTSLSMPLLFMRVYWRRIVVMWKLTIGKGICLQMQNMTKLAFESFAEAIRLEPENACALTYCGILYKEEGCLVEAAEAVIDYGPIGKGRRSYQKALRADPAYKPAAECLAIVLTDIGTGFKLAGSVQEGIQKYYEALKIDPHYAPAYYNLGVVYSEMMQFDLALNCYEKAVLERPMYAEAYCNLGVIYKNRNDLESSIACYEGNLPVRCLCLAVSPNFEIAKNNMAIALTDLGTKAIVFYELAIHFNPHCAEACNNLGVIYKDRDNLDKAVECINWLCQSNRNFSQSLNNLGVVFTVQGKMDAAANLIEKAIIANPTTQRHIITWGFSIEMLAT
ncbi:hypothetical protein RGQ29_025789 [Quercus rubra]|uniref:UDP-N-acetylglucosamine--peptide N-acetylglucosaminyltransferase SPINDLY n=1 Tax=Quercus rubra TaxID=3512 RepID=A0AAN7EZC6_QUERU|nr:hypothetical protein RGQ29_025789 [Quercus rubra]